MKRSQKITISVIGGHEANDDVAKIAQKLGNFIAKVGLVLICGGLRGVMEAVSRGAKEAGGVTIGILPGKEKIDANPYIDIVIPTSIGFARNAIIACSGDIVVALPGSHGTNTEICYALVYGRPVIDLGNWNIPGMISVKDLHEAEIVIKKLIKKIQSDS